MKIAPNTNTDAFLCLFYKMGNKAQRSTDYTKDKDGSEQNEYDNGI